jgi:hypothetical protein
MANRSNQGIRPSDLNTYSRNELLEMSNLSSTYTNAQLQSELKQLKNRLNKRTLKNRVGYATGLLGVNTNTKEYKMLQKELAKRKTKRNAKMNYQMAPKTNANLVAKRKELEAKKVQTGLLNWEQKMLNDLTYVTERNDPTKRNSNVSVLTTSSDPGVSGGRRRSRRYRKRFTRRR